jgi:hypothetical protein
MFSKGISAFLQAPETQMCEFWNLWYNTVSQQLQGELQFMCVCCVCVCVSCCVVAKRVFLSFSEDATCDIMFDFSYSEDFNKLYWNSAG